MPKPKKVDAVVYVQHIELQTLRMLWDCTSQKRFIVITSATFSRSPSAPNPPDPFICWAPQFQVDPRWSLPN